MKSRGAKVRTPCLAAGSWPVLRTEGCVEASDCPGRSCPSSTFSCLADVPIAMPRSARLAGTIGRDDLSVGRNHPAGISVTTALRRCWIRGIDVPVAGSLVEVNPIVGVANEVYGKSPCSEDTMVIFAWRSCARSTQRVWVSQGARTAVDGHSSRPMHGLGRGCGRSGADALDATTEAWRQFRRQPGRCGGRRSLPAGRSRTEAMEVHADAERTAPG